MMSLNNSCIKADSPDVLTKLATHYEAMALELRNILDQLR